MGKNIKELSDLLKQREAELAVINSVQQGLVADMDMQGIYDLIGDHILQIFGVHAIVIRSLDIEADLETWHYAIEKGVKQSVPPRPLDNFARYLNSLTSPLVVNHRFIDFIREFSDETSIEGEIPKSAVFVPLVAGETQVGNISLQDVDHEGVFTDDDVRLLTTLANSMSVALKNARLFTETEKKNAELAVINSVQEGLVREMELGAIYKLVGEKICDVLNTQTLVIRTFDHVSKMEHWQYAVEMGKVIDVDPQPFIFASEILIDTKRHLLISSDFEEFAVAHGDTPYTKGMAPKSAVFIPMIVGGKVVGSVSLQNVLIEHAFSESDVQLITTLTNSMSVAIENARLFNETTRLLLETEQRASEMQTVNNISRAMVSQLEFDKLIILVGEQMRETFKADIVYLALHNRETNMLHFPYFYGDEPQSRPFGNGITEKIILKKEPILINQNLDDAYFKLKAEKKGETVESFLGVPIMAGNESIGVISVQSKEQENRFNENDMRLLNTIAASVSVAMQNADAYQKMRSALTDLEAAQEQLVQQEKLASLGQLTAGIAHEIKNPLNFVNNFSDVSMEMIDEALMELAKANQDEHTADTVDILNDIKSNLAKIHEHGTRADGIVKSMLMHSRGGSGNMEPTNLNAMLKEYTNLAFHGMRAGKNPINVDIDLQLDESVGNVPMITEDFSRVILNLCNNAFDAMRDLLKVDGDSAKSRVKNTYRPVLTVRTSILNGKVSIEIKDNGPGIPNDIKDKILQPFFTTKKGTQGTGLGLSITNDIIKAHGGSLSVQSEPGQTIFTIILSN